MDSDGTSITRSTLINLDNRFLYKSDEAISGKSNYVLGMVNYCQFNRLTSSLWRTYYLHPFKLVDCTFPCAVHYSLFWKYQLLHFTFISKCKTRKYGDCTD